jgi:formylglycine-generating enzyme
VTRSQYAAFLASGPSTASQQSTCSSNTTFTPTSNWPPSANDKYPVTFVDWCDAVAFCQWAGGRLCGGTGGAPYDSMYAANASISEWYNACSAGGALAYPYGNTYEPSACNGRDFAEAGTPSPLPVGSLASCVGGEDGLFDMSGNVFEWDTGCEFDSTNPNNSLCAYRGGGYASSNDELGCTEAATILITTTLPTIGFRCCADPAASDAGATVDASVVDATVNDSATMEAATMEAGSVDAKATDAAKDAVSGAD